MKKKIYVAPRMVAVIINTESHLLDASQQSTVSFSTSEYSGGGHRSR